MRKIGGCGVAERVPDEGCGLALDLVRRREELVVLGARRRSLAGRSGGGGAMRGVGPQALARRASARALAVA